MTEIIDEGALIIVRGQVQGVGFRPTVWRLAKEMGLVGDVCNASDGVRIRLWGEGIATFIERLKTEAPPLARIQNLERHPLTDNKPSGFDISDSVQGEMKIALTPDITTCQDCLDEIRDPFHQLYRYPFANCTNCGPRFSILYAPPYDRNKTSMKAFDMCGYCEGAYRDPADRRYHAQPIACHQCGPKAWIEKLGEGVVNYEAFSMLDDVDAVGGMMRSGKIVAIKGIGGFHLGCDATQHQTVVTLRQRKKRKHKPFALMARDLDIIKEYAHVSAAEARILSSPEGPIVLLEAKQNTNLSKAVAPGLTQIGFMLPTTPLYHIMLKRMPRPVVMTSGNISGQPQCYTNEQAREKLVSVADFACLNNRDIVNRIDDSVVRIDAGKPRIMRRARGYAPASLPLPKGFENSPDILAFGADLKNTFCLVKAGDAILSQHMGDLEDPSTLVDLDHNLALYEKIYDHAPKIFAIDQHPGYHASTLGKERASQQKTALYAVQHHHAHIACCMAENNWPLDGGEILGVALDGAGWGGDGTIWGGEFLACSYTGYARLACFKPVPLLGGDAAARSPWRNAYAHIMAEMGWAEFAMNFADLAIFKTLIDKPRATLDAMARNHVNSPLASSCGRLFDAASAIAGLADEDQSFEGQAAMAFEAAIDPSALAESADLDYPFSIPLIDGKGLPYIEPLAVWRAMMGDLILQTPVGVIAARFHRGLARVIIAMVKRLMGTTPAYKAVALSGGCFQNQTLFQLVHQGLEKNEIPVLSHSTIPANDGGIALGQAVIAAANHKKIMESDSYVSRNSRPNFIHC